ncbi:MAG: response regulator [Marinifilaceae bacterium]
MSQSIFKFRNWRIKYRLLFLTVITIFSILILGFSANYFFKTSKVLGIILNAERVHNNTFQEGVDDYYNFVITKESDYYASAILKIEEANQMALLFGQLEEKARELNQEELAEILFATYKEAYYNDKEMARLMANRLRLFSHLKNPQFLASQKVATKGYELGTIIKNKILSHKQAEIDKALHDDLHQMRIFYKEFASNIGEIINYINNLLLITIFIILIGLGAFISWFFYLISKSITTPVLELVKSFKIIASGNLQTKISITGNNEMSELARSFIRIQNGLQNVIQYTQKVAEGDFSKKLNPKSKKDELTLALNRMTEQLELSHIKNQQENWFKDGLNELNKRLKGNLTPDSIAQNTMDFLNHFLEVELGALYILNRDTQHLEMKASIGLSKADRNRSIHVTDGILGQVIKTKTIKQIAEIPADYFKISTGMGEMLPTDLLILPLLFQNEVWGTIELASVKKMDEIKVDFLNTVNETITIAIASSMSRSKVQELLEKTQDQASELQVQQEELRVANEELSEQTKSLTENEKKLQVQQEELRVTNEELEERTRQLEMQKEEIEEKNRKLLQAHESLEKKAVELEQSSSYKSEFLANMSHELRTPLNSLLILSGVLAKNKEGNLSPDQIESAEIIHRSGTDLLQLINEILDLSKIEAGKMDLYFQNIRAEELREDIFRNFKHQAEEKKLDLIVEISDKFPETLRTDMQRISQILKNLLSNAFKFTQSGSISVLLEKEENTSHLMRKDLQQTEIYSISVKDTGVGIPDEKKEAIFEAFQQADGSISRQYGGTGLGLSISKELSRMLGGEIHLESELNHGSTFTVYLPLLPEDQTKEEKTASPISEDQTIENTPATLPQFIEDDRNNPGPNPLVILIHPDKQEAGLMYDQIHQMQFNAVVASNITEAIALIEAYHPVAIIMSIATTLHEERQMMELLKENPLAGKLPLHLLNPIEGIQEWELEQLPTAEGMPFEKVVAKIKKQLYSETKRILIVEDNHVTRKIIRDLIVETDATIDEAGSAAMAFDLIQKQKYDCVILDLGLPDYSGEQLLDQLALQKTPIPNTIIYTGKSLSREEHRKLSKYTNSIILKGLKSDERLMDEVTLFLHQVANEIPEKQQININQIDDSIFKGKKILVVDDEIRNVFALGKILEEKDIEVLEAENGRIAIDVLKENKEIDLVLMDVMMPEMDGYEAMTTIRQTSGIMDVPIICLTAKAMKEDYEKAISSGANDYLPKPVDENKLFSMLKIWLYN